MEDLLLSSEEHKVLMCHKKWLEKSFFVKICVPELKSSNDNDIIFATVYGNSNNINKVQEFLNAKCDTDVIILSDDDDCSHNQNAVPVITLSDSDSETSHVLIENQTSTQCTRKRRQNVIDDIDLTSSSSVCKDDSVCEVSSTTFEPAFKKRNVDFYKTGNYISLHSELTRKFLLKPNLKIETSLSSQQNHEAKKGISAKRKRRMRRRKELSKRKKCSPMAEFIPLKINSDQTEDNRPVCKDNSILVAKKVQKEPKLLRPIVIDGSNVAREHGKKDNTFSCKGIKLSVEHFLQRGHTQVTAFIPNYRRHCKFGRIITTDQPILEELAKSGHVVFTPSRRVNGKTVACYDDRFIVELAAKNGGVILSNDNYKDLIVENESFKKTIEERLLMFCFVDDLLMIPNDPLGRNGPSLEDYLSFPEEKK